MKIDDQQLDTWLKDISIPPDLPERLKQLSDSAAIRKDALTNVKAYVIAAIALAASVAGFALLYWQPRATDQQLGNSRPPAMVPDHIDSGDLKLSNNYVARDRISELDDIRTQGVFITDAVHLLQLARLRRVLEKVESDEPQQAQSIGRDELAALIVSLTGQTALESGAPRDWVKRDMSLVVERFPATHGATIARQWLADETIQ